MFFGKIRYISSLINNYSSWFDIILSRIEKRPITMVSLRNGTTLFGGEKSLLVDIVDEVFVKKVYNPSFLEIEKGDIVVDIGANIGVFSVYAAICGASKIYAIEPLSDNLTYIRKNFKYNGLNTPDCVNKAIYSKKGSVKLYLSEIDSHGQVFKFDNKESQDSYRRVMSIRFLDFLRDYKIKKIDFLKVDCEGGEGFLFGGTTRRDWEFIKKIAIEYHNNVSILSSDLIINKLVSFGYETKIIESNNLYGYIYAWR